MRGGRLAVRLHGQEEDVDVAELLTEAGCARKQSQSCIFGLEAEVELELLGGKTNSKVAPSGQIDVLPPLTEMVKQDARLMKGKGNSGERENEGKSGARRLHDQDINANVKKSVAGVTNAKEVVEESYGAVDREKLVKDKPHVEAQKPEEKRSFEENPDRSNKSPLENKNHGGVNISAAKNPVSSKKHVDVQAKKKNLEATKHQVEDRPEGSSKEGTVNGDKTSEIKENQVDPRKPPEEKPIVEVKLAKDRDCVVKQKPAKEEKNVMESKRSEVKRLCRGQFPSNCNQFSAEVCHFVSPEQFFLCSKEQQDKFLNIMLEIQESQESQEGVDVLREAGTACLAFYEKDGMFYRAEIAAFDSGKDLVTVFLVDHGAKITLLGNQLRPLGSRFLEEPGCVVEAALAGVQPVGEAWGEEDNEMAGLVLSPDVPLDVEVVGEKDGKVMVNLTDPESNNLAVLLVEAGVAAAPKDLMKRIPVCEPIEVKVAKTPLTQPALTYGELESGSMMVFAAASPLDLHLSTGALFEQYSSTVYPVVEEAGAKGVVQKEVIVSQQVFLQTCFILLLASFFFRWQLVHECWLMMVMVGTVLKCPVFCIMSKKLTSFSLTLPRPSLSASTASRLPHLSSLTSLLWLCLSA